MNNSNLFDRYQIRDMTSWNNIEADLIITDPPFGINFDGKSNFYQYQQCKAYA